MKILAVSLLSLPFLSACVASQGSVAPTDPKAATQAFETLQSFAGKWHGTATIGTLQTPVDLSYEIVSAGSTVMERLFIGTPHEMVTMYHRDGDRLVLTHYCAAGNQPRMELVSWSPAPEPTLTFELTDATNWPDEKQVIMHDARITKISPDHIAASWTAWSSGKPDHAANFDFTRVH